MKAIIIGLLFVSVSCGYAQPSRPQVMFQSGFSYNANATFEFSPGGHWLEGYNDGGEYLLWDLKTGKEIQKFMPFHNEYPSLFYTPRTSFSNDDSRILVPDYPRGGYLLYNINDNRLVRTFKPEDTAEYFTNAAFSADGTMVILLGEKGGDTHFTELVIYGLHGELVKRSRLDVPPFEVPNQFLLKLLLHKAFKALKSSTYFTSFLISDRMDQIYLSTLSGKTYALNINGQDEYAASEFREIHGLPPYTFMNAMRLYQDKLIAKGDPIYSFINKAEKSDVEITDTLFVINRYSLDVEKRVVSNMIVLTNERSNGINGVPITCNQGLNTIFDTKITSPGHYLVAARDVISGEKLFSYESGNTYFFNTTGNYQPGALNGGYIVALSADRHSMAENTRELVVHEPENKTIQTVIPGIRGLFKIAAPLFLDSDRVLIPKFYNDGFVLNLKQGTVERLKRELDCQDTVHNGSNVYFPYDNTAQLGIQNSVLSPVRGQFITTNIVPNSFCRLKADREITIWDAKTLRSVRSYFYPDREYTYSMSGISGHPEKFLINYKLVDFENPDQPKVLPLTIIHKRDTFYSANPVYLRESKQIFGIAATRTKPGNPNLIFALWDLDGKLLKSVTYQRPKSKMEWQTLITSAQLSPDSTKALFCLYDGTAGIVDIKQLAVTSLYEHGKRFKVSFANVDTHNNITAATFIDNEHFVTNGENNEIVLRQVGKHEPERVINKSPGYYASLKLSPDKKYLLAVSFDKAVHFINLLSGEDDANFLVPNTNAYTLLNKDGFYMSSQQSVNDLSFFYDGRAFDYSQFDLSLNRPDKVLETLGYVSPDDITDLRSAREKRLQKMKYQLPAFESLRDYDAPAMVLNNLPGLLRPQKTSMINFNVAATDAVSFVNKLLVTVNGVPLYGSQGLSIRPQKSVNIPVSMQLATGLNQITVSVMNAAGVESLRQAFAVTGPEQIKKPDLYIVAIACGAFNAPGKNLAYAVKDARDVVSLFKDQGRRFDHVFADTLFNQQVTLANIGSLKKKLLLSHPDDVIILYYAGHGLVDKNLDYYLSTYMTDFSKPALRSLAYDRFESLADSIPARNKLILIDACYSGEIGKEDAIVSVKSGLNTASVFAKQEKINRLMLTYFSDLRRSNGASEIGASGPAEQALEQSGLRNGVFTYFLKKGLRNQEADLNHDGQITVSELAAYLKEQVYNYTQNAQQPTLRHQNIVNDIVLWN